MTSRTARPAAPTLSRRHAAGATSARGLLFTLLGEFVLPGGGTAWTSSVIDVLGRLGVEEKASRQALMRTAADGWLTSDRVGRRTRWSLSPAGRTLLVDGTERIFGFAATATGWDGRWLVVLARTPETERPTRHLLRTRLSWAGLGSPAPGVWIGPHADRLPEVAAVLADAGMSAEAQVFVAEHRGAGDLPAMARQAWDLDAIEQAYHDFCDTHADLADRPPVDPLVATVELVHAWRRFPWTDPALPTALLPRHWTGAAAARLFTDLHARWVEPARLMWAEVNA